MSTVLLLKLMLVPLLIAGVTLAGRRWGPGVAGWLSAFPVVSGPILLFMAMEQGPAFAAKAAQGTLSAVLAILAFGIAYAWAATRYTWPASLATGFVAYFISVAGINHFMPSLWQGAPAVLIALLLAPRFYPKATLAAPTTASKPANDIAPRMFAGALLVWTVTHFAASMGAGLSGVFAMFPVMGSVLVVFSHRRAGSAFAIHLLKGMVLGYYAFSAFCIVLVLALPWAGIQSAFPMALFTALVVQTGSRLALHRHAPSALAQDAQPMKQLARASNLNQNRIKIDARQS